MVKEITLAFKTIFNVPDGPPPPLVDPDEANCKS